MSLKSCALALAALSLAIPASAQTPAAKPKSSSSHTTHSASTYDRALLHPGELRAKAPDTYQVKFVTENRNNVKAEFTVTVTRAWSPLGADRFYNLVRHHYFDNARFFRVLPGFVAQFGLSAYPQVNAAWEKATIKDDPRNQSNRRGTLVFATAGPNTRTTQLFINFKDNTSLDAQGFTPFGVVDGDGMNTVEMLYDQYGETAGMDQENITKGGEKYIAAHWPKLDKIVSATLVGTAATAPAHHATSSTHHTTAKPATASPIHNQ